MQQTLALIGPGRRERSPAHTPLRTVRESFPSHGSSLSKISLCRGDPAIKFLFVSIMESRELILTRRRKHGDYLQDKCARRKIAASRNTRYIQGRRDWRLP